MSIMGHIKIVIATPDEIESLRDLTKKLVESLGQKFEPKRFDWGITRRLYDPLQRHGILIAKDDETDETIGMIIAELRIDPFGASEGYIKQVFLDEDYRGQGIGKQLLQGALEHLRKIKVERVKVNLKEQAQDAAKVYKKMNFKKVYEVLELDLNNENT